jgi:Cu(I)-responsive transcriptional regulator
MNIGQASAASGVSTKMIRYYESIGLVPPADRRKSGYRDYGSADVHRLRFIRRARDLNFSLDQIADLLRLWSDRHRSNAEVKAIALQHVAELNERAKHLNEMANALKHLASACEGNGRPECPIIEGLEGAHELMHCATPTRSGKAKAREGGNGARAART